MGIAAIAAGIGAVATTVGTVVSMEGQSKAADAEKQAVQLKQTQMNLDASRQRRDIARRALVTRANAEATATSQGAQFGSGLQGGFAQISGQAGEATVATNQNQNLGNQLYGVNQQITAGQTLAQTGQGISQLGGQLYQNREMLGRVGSYITGNDSWFKTS